MEIVFAKAAAGYPCPSVGPPSGTRFPPPATWPTDATVSTNFLFMLFLAYVAIAFGAWLLLNFSALRKGQLTVRSLMVLTLLAGPAVLILKWLQESV